MTLRSPTATLIPLFSRAHWVRISWSIGSEISFGHVPPLGVESSTFARARRAPYPIDQALRYRCYINVYPVFIPCNRCFDWSGWIRYFEITVFEISGVDCMCHEELVLLTCPAIIWFHLNIFGDGRVVRWCWVNFQCRSVLQIGL